MVKANWTAGGLEVCTVENHMPADVQISIFFKEKEICYTRIIRKSGNCC